MGPPQLVHRHLRSQHEQPAPQAPARGSRALSMDWPGSAIGLAMEMAAERTVATTQTSFWSGGSLVCGDGFFACWNNYRDGL